MFYSKKKVADCEYYILFDVKTYFLNFHFFLMCSNLYVISNLKKRTIYIYILFSESTNNVKFKTEMVPKYSEEAMNSSGIMNKIEIVERLILSLIL